MNICVMIKIPIGQNSEYISKLIRIIMVLMGDKSKLSELEFNVLRGICEIYKAGGVYSDLGYATEYLHERGLLPNEKQRLSLIKLRLRKSGWIKYISRNEFEINKVLKKYIDEGLFKLEIIGDNGETKDKYEFGTYPKMQKDVVYERILKEVSVEYGISVDYVERTIYSFYQMIRENISNADVPIIRIPMIGTIKPQIYDIYKMCIKYENIIAYGDREKRAGWRTERKEFIRYLSRLQDSYFRLEKELSINKDKWRLKVLAARREMYKRGLLNKNYWDENGEWRFDGESKLKRIKEDNLERIRQANI